MQSNDIIKFPDGRSFSVPVGLRLKVSAHHAPRLQMALERVYPKEPHLTIEDAIRESLHESIRWVDVPLVDTGDEPNYECGHSECSGHPSQYIVCVDFRPKQGDETASIDE